MASIISEHIPPQLKPGHNWAYLVLLLLVSSLVLWDYATSNPLENLYDPVSAVADSLGPELEYFDGLEDLPGWQKTLLNFPGPSRYKFTAEAVKTWRDVLITIQQDPDYFNDQELQVAQAQLFILLTEERNYQAAVDETNTWPSTDSPLLKYVSSVYAKQLDVERPEHDFFDTYPNNWATLRLLRKEAEIREDQQNLVDINSQIQNRADTQIIRSIFYTIVWWVIIIAGLLLFLFYARTVLSISNRYQLAWPVGDAIGVYIRAELVIILIILLQSIWYAFSAYIIEIDSLIDAFYSWSSLLSGLITVLFIYLFLTKPRQTTFREVFGLSVSRMNGVTPLLLWIMVLMSLDYIGIILINQIASGLGVNAPWAEGISETLLWGSPFEVSMEAIDTVIWAPIYEELIFRGVLYLGLRKIYSPIVAAILSASIFSLLHFYSITGFFEILWGGILYALAFEYSRSLLPAIGAHMLFNLNWLLYSLIFYRL